jgi:hypothetical protein
MSGAVAAHAAYNGSGTQGLAVTDRSTDSDVMSVFWNKNNVVKQLVHGSSIMEIPPTGNGGSLSSGGNQIFTVNDDIDAIGDLYLQITTSGNSSSKTVKAFDLVNCIKRIEFRVGNQIWQTLEGDDINALNLTEMSEEAFESYVLHMSGGISSNGTRNALVPAAGNSTVTTSSNVTGVIRIPCLTRTLGPKFSKFTDISEGAYMLAGASAQKVQIKVTMKSSMAGGTLITQSGISFSLKLFGQCMVMCNEERQYVRGASASTPVSGLAKRIKMTQNSTTNVATGTFDSNEATVNIDLDQFSLYCSHLVIQVIPGTTTEQASIKTAELKLNSTSFSGELDGGLLTGAAADSLGLYANGTRGETGVNRFANCYIFPLASRAYSGSSVPLNRFDNIRLTLGLVRSGATDVTVNVTCVGQTTALYLKNAASLAMY